MDMFQDLYFIPYNWTLLHLLAVFEPENLCKSPSYSDFKVPFIVDGYGNTPLHYLISHGNIDYSSVNYMLKYIIDYLEDKDKRTAYESTLVLDSISNIFPFIMSKTSPALVNRLLKLCFATPSVPIGETLPRFGKKDTKCCLVDSPVLTPVVQSQVHEKGQDQIAFSALKLKLDFSHLSDDMLNNVLTLNELDNEEYFRSKTISSLINHLWHKSRIFHGVVGLFFLALMVLVSVYIGLGETNRGLEISILVLSSLFTIYEGLQVVLLRMRYFKSIWNFVDISFFLLIIATMITRLADNDHELARHWLLSIIIITGYIRLMSYFRLFTPTSNLLLCIDINLINRKSDSSNFDYPERYVGCYDHYYLPNHRIFLDFPRV